MPCLALRVKIIITVVVLVALSACSDKQPGKQSQAITQKPATPAVSTVKTAAEKIPTYPTSKLTEQLVWETNNEDPVFSSPDAKKGGTLHLYINAFPLTLRVVGPDANNAMRSLILDNQLSPVSRHPNTGNIIPELATQWAYGKDNKTVYYKLNPKARWSDGTPITADDYIYTLDFMRSKYIVAPWYNNYYSEEIKEVKKYDDYTISITGATAKPKKDLHYYYGLGPTPRHFYKLDKNWVQNYNWKIAPNSGPYQLTKIEKGEYLEFTLKDNWWGKDLRYFKNRYNVKKIRVKVIRDEEVAFQYFLKGDLDVYNLSDAKFWHDKAKGELFDDGFIDKIWFYNDIPRGRFGFYLNLDRKIFQDKNLRYGLAHAIDVNGVIKDVHRGDYSRLHSFHTGYGEYSNPNIRAREFDLNKADKYLKAAGWGERGPDGIRVKDGKRLSIRISYSSSFNTDTLVYLKEQAKKAGIDLELELLDAASFFRKVGEKSYDAIMMNFGTGYRPTYWEFMHSVNAHKKNTNNVTNTDNKEIDDLIMRYRRSVDEKERIELARNIDMLFHEQGAYIPLFMVPYTRSAYWRWVKLPNFYGTKESDSMFNPFGTPGGLLWIDKSEKEHTLSVKKEGGKFAPVTIIDETYRVNE